MPHNFLVEKKCANYFVSPLQGKEEDMTKNFGLFVFGSLAVLEGLFCGVTRKNSLSFIPFCRHQKGFDESAKSQLDWHSRNDFVLSRKKQVVLLYN